ncbi:MAG: hypothetical protein ABR915_01900 [Thermoguttaceae bacterium]|jgi:hypothetical protein
MIATNWKAAITVIMALALADVVVNAEEFKLGEDAALTPAKVGRLFGTCKDEAIPVVGGKPWPSNLDGFKVVEPGEHPRLLFRKSDIPMLREKAQTPEGQAILARLRATLDGRNGDTFPAVFNASGHAYQGNKPVGEGEAHADSGKANSNKKVGKSQGMPLAAYTMSHAAGYGLLYQLTGERRYADLGKEAFDKALEGVRDRDDRYSFRKPGGALRCGPSLGWYALGYDLCYDGWDPAYRQKIAAEFSKYDEGPNCSIASCARGQRQHPGSNHWGMEVGGSAMAVLAILNDPGADMGKIGPLVKDSAACMVRNLTQGFGDGGFFAEGDGTGSMSSHIAFLTALQAWRNVAGLDFVSPRPNAQWAAYKWFFLTQSAGGKPVFLPQRGAYPHDIWSRAGLSGGGYFSIGLGIADANQKAAILWYYDHFGFKAADAKAGTPCDTPSPYPHHSVLAFVNWPVGLAEKNPGEVFPHAYRDSKWGFYAWRNRWQDQDDVIISILTKATKGNYGCKPEQSLSILSGGRVKTWGTISGGFTGEYAPLPDGSTVLTTGDGSCLAIDFSRASGADALLVMTGPGAPGADALDAGGTKFSLLVLGKAAPKPQVQGGRIVVGGQTISSDGKRIVLGK